MKKPRVSQNTSTVSDRRSKGTGSITRTKSGKFKGTLSVVSSIDGKRHRVSKTCDTLEEVQEFFREVTGKDMSDYSPTTVAEYWEHYLKMKEGVYRESTLAGAKNFYEKHVKGSILDTTRFMDLDETIINRYFLGLSARGKYSTSTLTRWRKNFKSILELAVYEGYLKENPMNSPRIIKKLKGRMSRPIYTFTKKEVSQLLNKKNLSTLPLLYQTYIILAFITGARPQELLALEQKDISIDKVSFNKSLGFQGKLQNCMKTPWSVRVVPIPRKYGEILENNKKALPKKLFASDKSTYGYISKDNMNERFKQYVHTVLKDERRHHLYETRHTYATLLITVDKVDVKAVSRLMGHNNIETTLKYYTRVTFDSSCYAMLHV